MDEIFQSNVQTDAELFWIKIRSLEDFKELAEYALNCLTTPVSNATVDGIFSLVTNVKTKVRNRMGLNLLDSIVCIRSKLHMSVKCCNTFTPSLMMLQKFNSKELYPS